MASPYSVGSQARITASFSTAAGVAADPTTVTLLIKCQTGSMAYVFGSSAIAKDAVGRYHYDVTFTCSGAWKYRWTGTGAVAAATPDAFIVVNPTVFVP